MPRLLLPLYFLLAILEIYAEVTLSEPLILSTKPLLLTVLSLWFYLQNRPLSNRFTTLLFTGLMFSIGGDTLLMFVEYGPKDEMFFLLGLGSFLVAQVSYAIAFWTFPEHRKGLVYRKPGYILPFAAYLAGMLMLLWPGLPGAMRVPVVVYALAIVLMAIGAFNLKGLIPKRLFWGLVTGVLLFVLSDSLIAVNKFVTAVPFARFSIMSTYLLGQFFIAYYCTEVQKQ